MPTGADAAQLMFGRIAPIFRSFSRSRTTMKCHGWLFFELPVHLARSSS